MTATSNTPIIIKRKKVVAGGGHHGGAWKVAYADFVTAMMAFFMLMWLLNATTEQQRKGIADYFSPAIPLAKVSGGGAGALGGSNPTLDSRMEFEGHGSAPFNRGTPLPSTGKDPAKVAAMENAESELLGKGGESLVADKALRHVRTRVTDEGLVIEIFDRGDAHMFSPDTQEPTQLLRDLIPIIAEVLAGMPNDLAIASHVRSSPTVRRDDLAWPLSMGRADAVRQMLAQAGLPMRRVVRATGHGDNKLATAQPLSSRNNRTEIIILYDTE